MSRVLAHLSRLDAQVCPYGQDDEAAEGDDGGGTRVRGTFTSFALLRPSSFDILWSTEVSSAPISLARPTPRASLRLARPRTAAAATPTLSTLLSSPRKVAAPASARIGHTRRRCTRAWTTTSLSSSWRRRWRRKRGVRGKRRSLRCRLRGSASVRVVLILLANPIDAARTPLAVDLRAKHTKFNSMMTNLRQIANHPLLKQDTRMPNDDPELIVKLSGKMMLLDRLLPALLERGHKVRLPLQAAIATRADSLPPPGHHFLAVRQDA